MPNYLNATTFEQTNGTVQAFTGLFRVISGNTVHPREPVPRFRALFQRDLGRQVECIERLNRLHAWGLTGEELDWADAHRVAWPERDGLISVALVPYVPDAILGMWRDIGHRFQRNTRSDPYRLPSTVDPGGRAIYAVNDNAIGRRLRWEVIDLGCHVGRVWNDFHRSPWSPTLGVVASAMHHPDWLRHIGREEIPNVCIPGMFRLIVDADLTPFIPAIGWVSQAEAPEFHYRLPTCSSRYYAVPQFFELP